MGTWYGRIEWIVSAGRVFCSHALCCLIRMASPERHASLSFSGSGVLATFHAGVAHYISTRIFDGRVNEDVKLLGTSGGAIVAVLMATDFDFSRWVSIANGMISETLKDPIGPLRFGAINRARMSELLPSDAHMRCSSSSTGSSRLTLSVTRFPSFSNVRLSQFTNKEDLLDAVALSSYFPLFYSWVPRFRGGALGLDGGITDNQPLAPCPCCNSTASTVTINPIDDMADIHGAPELRWYHTFHLASHERLRYLFALGFRRAEAKHDFLMRRLRRHLSTGSSMTSLLMERKIASATAIATGTDSAAASGNTSTAVCSLCGIAIKPATKKASL